MSLRTNAPDVSLFPTGNTPGPRPLPPPPLSPASATASFRESAPPRKRWHALPAPPRRAGGAGPPWGEQSGAVRSGAAAAPAARGNRWAAGPCQRPRSGLTRPRWAWLREGVSPLREPQLRERPPSPDRSWQFGDCQRPPASSPPPLVIIRSKCGWHGVWTAEAGVGGSHPAPPAPVPRVRRGAERDWASHTALQRNWTSFLRAQFLKLSYFYNGDIYNCHYLI